MIQNIYLSDFHGCAYALDEDDNLIMTPMHEDCTFDSCFDNWIEVDEMALLGEEEKHRAHVEWVRGHLRVLNDGLFAGAYAS